MTELDEMLADMLKPKDPASQPRRRRQHAVQTGCEYLERALGCARALRTP
jgi:hypothetical protein